MPRLLFIEPTREILEERLHELSIARLGGHAFEQRRMGGLIVAVGGEIEGIVVAIDR